MKQVCLILPCLLLSYGCSPSKNEPATQPAIVLPPAATQPAAAASQPADDPYANYHLVRPPEVVDALVFQVNDHTFTVHDILKPIRGKLTEIPAGLTEELFRREADKLIAAEIRRQTTEALVLDEAKRSLAEEEIKQIEEDLNGVLRDMIAEHGGSRTKLDLDLRAEGTTLEEAIEAERRQMTARRYLNRKFVPRLGVSRVEMVRYYQQNREGEFSSSDKTQMQVLCVPYRSYYPQDVLNPSAQELEIARQQARVHIEQAVEACGPEADFAAVVRQYGTGYRAEEGGLWEPMQAGSFRERKVEEAAFAQDVGTISDVIEGETGCFLVKTVAREDGRTKSFEEAQVQIEQKLRERQYDQMTREYFTELYGRATISSTDKFEQRVLDYTVKTYYRAKK